MILNHDVTGLIPVHKPPDPQISLVLFGGGLWDNAMEPQEDGIFGFPNLGPHKVHSTGYLPGIQHIRSILQAPPKAKDKEKDPS